ncbi:hypothetical protein BU16DRAFT_566032 [Lophium mytilinum]|uniref:DUF300-domain-containing protein n=1 Tax=Lophium mytilinum TaxID=390894 RepID=A0A6A6QI27_9PEZI|nr:hypothetical protein BU16DRAFT_566032 [Lophium mytilinum]
MSTAEQKAKDAAMQALLQAYKKAEETCTLPYFLSYAEPISGDFTYHKIITIVSGVCALITLAISLSHAYFHLTNYVNPGEQKQMIRIIITTPIYAIFNFWSARDYDQAGFLEPIAQLYECFALCSIFLLFLAYVAPHEETRLEFFHSLERQSRWKKGQKKHDNGSLKWFYVIWLCVFQLLPVRIITTTASEVIQGVICPLNQKNPKLAVVSVQSASTIIGLFAVLTFYHRLRPTLKPHGAMTKLLVFKCVIAVTLIQNALFSAFSSAGTLKPSKTASFRDLQTGTPAFMTCCEMLIFSIGFVWPFSPKPYLPGHTKQQYHKRYSTWHALKDVFNVWDIVSGVWFRYKVIAVFPFRTKPTPQIALPKSGTLKVWDTRYDRRASATVDSFNSENSDKSVGSSSEEESKEPAMVGRIQEV